MFKVLVLLISLHIVVEANYVQLREQFKTNLYNEQYGLMRHDEYMKFIEPHIAKIEKQLQVYQFLVKNGEKSLSKHYFDCLLEYNLAYFHYHVNASKYNNESVKKIRNDLLNLIQKINALGAIPSFDVQQEFKITLDAFHKTTEEYYKKLNSAIRFVLSIGRISYTPKE